MKNGRRGRRLVPYCGGVHDGSCNSFVCAVCAAVTGKISKVVPRNRDSDSDQRSRFAVPVWRTWGVYRSQITYSFKYSSFFSYFSGEKKVSNCYELCLYS